MLILGVDPGFEKTGIAVLRVTETTGACLVESITGIRTKASKEDSMRLLDIQNEFTAVLNIRVPDKVAMERFMLGANHKTAEKVVMAMGVMMCACGQRSIPVHLYTPSVIKKRVAGKGNANKEEVRAAVAKELRVSAKWLTSHEADALAAALTLAEDLKA